MAVDDEDEEAGGDVERLLEITRLLRRFSTEVTSAVDAALGTDDATNPEVRVACELHETAAVTPNRIMELARIDRRRANRLASRFESMGLVRRRLNPQDRRSSVFELTTSGRRRLERLRSDAESSLRSTQPLAKELVEMLTGSADAPESVGTVSMHRRGPMELVDRTAVVGMRWADAITKRSAEAQLDGRLHNALTILVERGALRAGDLAEELGLTSGGSTHLVAQLEERELIERRHATGAADRRVVTVELTAEGMSAALTIMSAVDDVVDDLADLFRQIRDLSAPE